MKALDAATAAFDGKHKEPLEDFAARQAPTAAVIRTLTARAGGPDQKQQSAATWLLKRYGENGLTVMRIAMTAI